MLEHPTINMCLEFLLVLDILLNLRLKKIHSVRSSGIHLRNIISVVIIHTNHECLKSTNRRLPNVVQKRDHTLTMSLLRQSQIGLSLLDTILFCLLEFKNIRQLRLPLQLSIHMLLTQLQVPLMISRDQLIKHMNLGFMLLWILLKRKNI